MLRGGEGGELGHERHAAERGHRIEDRAEQVGHQSERNEPERRAAAAERAAEVEGHDCIVEEQHGAGGVGQRRNPRRNRTADEVTSTGQRADKEQRPKRERGEFVARQGAARGFRHDVVDSGQGERREPEGKRALDIPAVDHRLEDAANRAPQQHRLGGDQQPREKEERGDRVPLRGEGAVCAASAPSENARDADRHIGGDEQRLHVTRHFEEREGRRITRGNPNEAE